MLIFFLKNKHFLRIFGTRFRFELISRGCSNRRLTGHLCQPFPAGLFLSKVVSPAPLLLAPTQAPNTGQVYHCPQIQPGPIPNQISIGPELIQSRWLILYQQLPITVLH